MRRSLTPAMLALAVLVAPAARAQAVRPSASTDPKMRAAVEDLVAANRILAKQGVIPRFGHVSMRSPVNPDHLLIARSLAPTLVTANDIVELDTDCNPIIKGQPASYLERYIHCAVYKARPDVNAVVHSHTPYVIAFSITKFPLRPVNHPAWALGPDGPPVHDIANYARHTNMLISNPALGKSLTDVLGKNSVVLMRGHGSTVVAGSIPAVVTLVMAVEENAMILSVAKGLGGPIHYLSDADEGNVEFGNAVNTEARGWVAMKQEFMGAQ